MSQRLYDTVTTQMASSSMPFLNWGYAPLDETEPVPELAAEDEPYRFSIQLYYHVLAAVDLKGLDVLEVGSGRGGGCDFIRRHFRARSVVGVDLLPQNVQLSQSDFGRDGVAFRQGDAESLPFDDNSFDAVVNIESSHCYPRLGRFFREVKRVLKPGAHFFYADFGNIVPAYSRLISDMVSEVERSGLELLQKHDITANVVGSLQRSSEAVDARLRQCARDEKQYQVLANNYRIVGTPGYRRFREGKDAYMSFLLRKPT